MTRHGYLKARNDTGVFYIGLGDQFDDDRRLVREATSEFRLQYVASTAQRLHHIGDAAKRATLTRSQVASLLSETTDKR